MINIKAVWNGLQEWGRAEDKWSNDVMSLTIKEIEQTAFRIERDAKMIVPILSGDLRKSLGTNVKKSRTSITTETGTDVVYSRAVELGSWNQRAQPYLIPAFDRNVKGLERAIDEILRG